MMMTRWRMVAVFIITVAILLLTFTGHGGPSHDDTPPAARCVEDMPCWDCHTMGNMICGDSNR